jgi:hypothetical protein
VVRHVWLGTIALAGCLRTTEFRCAEDAQCGPGVCEPVGYCSFDDPSCPGGRRFGGLSGAYSDQCLAAEPGPDAPGPDAPVAPFCDAAGEPTLVGCWELDGDLVDRSGDGNAGTGTGAIAYEAGIAGMALRLAGASHVAIADSASLTSPTISLEAWIRPTALPNGATRMGIFDNDGQYGLFLLRTGLTCLDVTATTAIAAGRWTHVACTYDGGVGRIYVDGAQVAMTGGGSPLGAGNASGSALGGNSPSGDTMVGLIDQVRVWTVARTAQQICSAAGRASCP